MANSLARRVATFLASLVCLLGPITSDAAVYTLSINTNGSGTVSRNSTNSVYPQGAVVTLTALPASGWLFASWSGDASGTTNPVNVTMNTNKSVTANFALIPLYTLTISTIGQGSVTPPGGSYTSNTVVALTASPSNGWQFLGWGGDAQGIVNPLYVTMTRNESIIASFVQLPAILSQPQSVTVAVGDTVTFTVTATGAPPLTYQWWFINSPITAATNASITLPDVQPSQVGEYSVVVANPYGTAT